jgi:hypothetical protein
VRWEKDDIPWWDDPSRYIVVNEPLNLTAVFADESLPTRVIRAETGNGKQGEVTGGGRYLQNEQAVLQAIPAEGHQFVRWSDGNGNNPRTITVTQDTTFTARFVEGQGLPTYPIDIRPNNDVMGTIVPLVNGTYDGPGIYAEGEEFGVKATPAAGYRFVRWEKDGIPSVEWGTDTLHIVVNETLNFTAVFADVSLSLRNIITTAINGEQEWVTGGGRYVQGEQAVLRATPPAGYLFVRWSNGNTANPHTVTVTEDATYTAEFTRDDYYRITLNVTPENWGTVSGDGYYERDTKVTIEATPADGYRFVQWSDGNTNNPRIVTVTKHVSFTAEFAVETYTLTLTSNNSDWGTITVNPAGPYTYGQSVELTANAVNGYRFVKWDDNITINPRIVTVTENVSFTAEFTANAETPTYTLTVNSNNPDWGTVAVDPEGPYTYGRQVVLTPVAANGYRFVKWDDDTTVNPRIVTVTGDMTFTAEFEANPETPTYTLTVNSNNPDWGTVAVNPEGPYTYSQSVTLTANAVNGYRFAKWSDNVIANPRTVKVMQDATFTAMFAANPGTPTYTLTVTSDNPDWGTVAVTPAGPYTQGQQVMLTPAAVNGYRFVKWDDNTADNPRTVTVKGDMVFTAMFAINPGTPTYTLTVNANNPDWGTVAVTPAGPYPQGQQVMLTPAAVNGYRFVRWNDNTTDNPRTVVVTGDMTFTADFAKENTETTYQITVRSINTNWGTVDGEGRYAEGEEVILIASPKSGYHFERWSDKNTDNPRLITVTGTATYIAVFAEGSDDTSDSPTPADAVVIVYPNPARDVLYIRSAVAIEQVVIRDLSGQQVKRFTAPVDREIDVSDLSPGVYLVGITTTYGETIRKIVISV